MHGSSRTAALSLVETLVTIAVLGALVGVSLFAFHRSSAHYDAAMLARALSSARWLAVSTGSPIALVFERGAVYGELGVPLSCELPKLGEPIWAATRSVVQEWPTGGLAFGAHGRPLRCDESGVGNSTITLVGGNESRAAVVVAALGRVRWERR